MWNLIESLPCPSIGAGSFLVLYVGSFVFGSLLLLSQNGRDRVAPPRKKRLYEKNSIGGRR